MEKRVEANPILYRVIVKDILFGVLHLIPCLCFCLKERSIYLLLPIFFIVTFLYMYGNKNSLDALTSRRFILLSTLLLIWITAYAFFENSNITRLIIKKENITELRGRLIRDSSFTKSHGGVYQIRITEIADLKTGIRATASGRITVITKEAGSMTEEGALVCFNVTDFQEDIVFASSMKILRKPSLLAVFRKSFLNDVERRIMALSPTSVSASAWEARKLSLMLLLSRFDGEEFPLKDRAKDVGIAHVFALSGMHLNLIASFVVFVISFFCPAFKRKFVVVPVLFLYTILVGASPSLVRAFLMYIIVVFFRDAKRWALFLSLILQTIFLRESVTSVAFIFSFVSTASLMVFSKFMFVSLSSVFIKPLSRFLSSGIASLLVTVPFSIIMFGFWSPYGILLSAPAAVLSALSMFGGFLAIILPGSFISSYIMGASYKLIDFLVHIFSKTPLKVSWNAYLVFVALILFVFFIRYHKAQRMLHLCKLYKAYY